jgi:hypothetical protein
MRTTSSSGPWLSPCCVWSCVLCLLGTNPALAGRICQSDALRHVSAMLEIAMTDDLLALISSGKLPSGTTLRHSFRGSGGDYITSTVVKDGIRIKGETYKTPSGAARAVTGKPVDGWLFWKLPTGEDLGTLRMKVVRG